MSISELISSTSVCRRPVDDHLRLEIVAGAAHRGCCSILEPAAAGSVTAFAACPGSSFTIMIMV